MGITAELCEKIVATGWDDLSEEAIQRTRRIMLDGIAVAVAGTIQEEAPEVLTKHVRNLGGTPTSTVHQLRLQDLTRRSRVRERRRHARTRLRADVAAGEPSSLDHVAGDSGARGTAAIEW